ncbi:FecR family protein [Maribacter ulvicola]|uniref:FecR family protein n=1 Tax=Maribacter ulvicola TaxID=228959 RepID=A0A1N6X8G3_9FLAO|nr:FecR family protein [Maribacter ulvicola]SIQ98521.1 FecR family protein [Maribacter ulvicola]
MNEGIEDIIIKFLTKEANIDELQKLELWLSNSENEALFNEYIKTNATLNISVGRYDKKKAKATILKQIRKEKFTWYGSGNIRVVKYAAAILFGIVAFNYFYQGSDNIVNESVDGTVTKTEIEIRPGTDKATLLLEDGSKVELEKGQTYQTKKIKSSGKELVYTKDVSTKEIKYNYLTIPRGGQFLLKLTDGTKVWLNSETQLKYPVSFVQGRPRTVELIYGEAYFEVTPSSENNGAKFQVINHTHKVEVIGTEFNIKAYRDEKSIYSTLVEGKIDVMNHSSKKSLIPGQQSNFNIENNSISIANVDVESVTSWRQGLFVFKEKPLKDIMRVLSRWYDVDVVFEDKKLETLKFRGVVSKDQEIEQIMSIIKSTVIKDYEIKGKTIILR